MHVAGTLIVYVLTGFQRADRDVGPRRDGVCR